MQMFTENIRQKNISQFLITFALFIYIYELFFVTLSLPARQYNKKFFKNKSTTGFYHWGKVPHNLKQTSAHWAKVSPDLKQTSAHWQKVSPDLKQTSAHWAKYISIY